MNGAVDKDESYVVFVCITCLKGHPSKMIARHQELRLWYGNGHGVGRRSVPPTLEEIKFILMERCAFGLEFLMVFERNGNHHWTRSFPVRRRQAGSRKSWGIADWR